MPTEVFELSPQQLDWLYEHQALKNVDPLHHHDLIATQNTLTCTTALATKLTLMDGRRDSIMGHDSCTASSTSNHSASAESRGPTEHEGITFPFNEERPTWEQSLANLVCYKERHGHCNVPRFYPTHRQLGSWVHRQRLKKKFPHKYGALKKEQMKKLEAAGFNWRVRKETR